jgi:F0F1-type ATP synthase assembly protein I
MQPTSQDRGASVFGAGLTLVVVVGLFAWGGYLLDGWLATTPLFTVIGALAGALGGFIHFLHRVAPELLPFGRKRGAKRQGERSDPRP